MIDLWDFQREDVKKLEAKKAVLLTNEMGTGKTRTAVALDLSHRESCPYERPKTLVVAPLNTLEVTWKKHFTELTDLRVAVIDPKNRPALLKADADIYVVHWDVLRLMPELRKQVWYHVIGDEIHKIKNRKAQQTKALKALMPTFKTGLSGTPVTNKPNDYWSVLHWLYPSIFRSYWKFFEEYVDYEIKYPEGYKIVKGPKNVDRLLKLVEPFTVRHLKKEPCCVHHPQGVFPDMPGKYYDQIPVELDPQQRRAYTQMKKDMLAWVGAQESTPLIAPIAVAKLVRLQQFAVAYADVTPDGVKLTEPSSKLDALMQMIENNPEKQFVVFSQFAQLIRLLETRLKKADISHGILTGDTPKPLRAGLVEAFQAGRIQIFAGTIKAGGVGLDLFAASTVVFLDRDWSPSDNKQAEDRLHRAGQKNAVQVIDIVATNTVDLGRHQMLELKWTWIKRLLGDPL